MSPHDEIHLSAMMEAPNRPFALFDIDRLGANYSAKSNPLPEGWRPEGLRPPFPATVFRYREPWDREIECLVAFADYGARIDCWVVFRVVGTQTGYLIGSGGWGPSDFWRFAVTDGFMERFKPSGNANAEQDSVEYVFSQTVIPFLAMYLLDCKNTEAEQVLPSRQAQRRAERRGESTAPEYRIVVKVPGTKAFTLAGPRRNGEPVLSAHMVRGHFAEYSAERPLFGKYTGRFWIPPHVRGKREEGNEVTPRDYVVVPVEEAA